MAELTPQERLQPSLLDRLTDDDPGKTQESRENRVLSMNRLRECVLRDLAWLFNAVCLPEREEIEHYPFAQHSVINFGLPPLSGSVAQNIDVHDLEATLRQTIWDFEPRILRNTVAVRVIVDKELMGHNTLTFEISGDLWAQPVPLQLFLKTEIDLETGQVKVEQGNSVSVR
ncbi:MAG TPA: type VI secretion system baseplate subunit TssE [Candidatus Competibacteraceae bacterium]|nr:MAG: type VI secretion system baseplate subunit TssE [Candidatus Competibacteraceae bacterium]HOB62083.1 type VI secretion system baseplate subunit TssE [Candidatus Competibacteraceae bacterium]HQA27186.1 type VI secretion system baseplate subunit TssE [Candidatus Competibacteraceae bacterium]HQD55202.1 type VI secretion system baseplate subunit TssE [Candidatus Competibacteraceae bacterium]